jgi:MtN3 and saliva related transmembrane protein
MELATQVVGFSAAGVSLFVFIPQTAKIYNGGSTHDLSAFSFIAILLGGALWLTYGVLLANWPLISTNVVQIVLTLYILYKMHTNHPKHGIASVSDTHIFDDHGLLHAYNTATNGPHQVFM